VPTECLEFGLQLVNAAHDWFRLTNRHCSRKLRPDFFTVDDERLHGSTTGEIAALQFSINRRVFPLFFARSSASALAAIR
jgi:hypothetical protein